MALAAEDTADAVLKIFAGTHSDAPAAQSFFALRGQHAFLFSRPATEEDASTGKKNKSAKPKCAMNYESDPAQRLWSAICASITWSGCRQLVRESSPPALHSPEGAPTLQIRLASLRCKWRHAFRLHVANVQGLSFVHELETLS